MYFFFLRSVLCYFEYMSFVDKYRRAYAQILSLFEYLNHERTCCREFERCIFSNPILSSVMCVLRCTEVGVPLVISSTTSPHMLQLMWQPSLWRPINLINVPIYGNYENPASQDSILTSRGKDCYGGYYRRQCTQLLNDDHRSNSGQIFASTSFDCLRRNRHSLNKKWYRRHKSNILHLCLKAYS